MKTAVFILFILFFPDTGNCQDRIGIELGMDKTWSYKPFLVNGPLESQSSNACSTFGVSYLTKMNKHLYIGGKAYYESYSFSYDRISDMNNYGLFGGGFDSTYGTHINFKASYLFLAPLFDIGMGRRQVFHIYAMPGMGILLNGQQSLRVYQTLNSVTQSDVTGNTSQDIYRLIFRFNVGLIQHIQLNNYWHLTFNESVGAVNVLSDEKGTNGVPLRPNYYTLQIGLMKKYHRRQN